jgi:hypothetical protein
MNESTEHTPPGNERILLIHYRQHALRVAISDEIRFVTEDICRITGIGGRTAANRLLLRLPETLGWSQTLNLLDCGDTASSELQRFGAWMMAGAIEQLCGNEALTGTERLDTSTAYRSSFFRKALHAADPALERGSQLLQ